MTTDVKTAEAAVTQAETDLAAGADGISADKLHKLRSVWRHADLTAQGKARKAEEERKTARLAGLAEIGEAVDQFAEPGRAEQLAEAVRDVAAACARVRELSAEHDAHVAELVAAAKDLGAEPKAPGGPRGTSAYVAVQGTAIVHKRLTVQPVGPRVGAALSYAVDGEPDRAVAEVQAATTGREPRRPDYVLRNPSGAILTFTGQMNEPMRAQIESGELTALSDRDIDRYMAGELA